MLLVAGFLDELWRDSVSVVGFSLTIVGLGFAIWQIRRAVTSSEAAAVAARQASDAIAFNIELTSLASGVRLIGEVDALVRSEQFDAASVRLSDLRELVVQLRNSREHNADVDTRFQESVALIATLGDVILRRHYRPNARFDPLAVHGRLGDVSDFLNGLASAGRLQVGG